MGFSGIHPTESLESHERAGTVPINPTSQPELPPAVGYETNAPCLNADRP